MADKEKRLRKIILNAGFKGKLKPVNTLEEATTIIVEDISDKHKNKFIRKEVYLEMVENGYTFSEETVYFTVSSKPRDKRLIEKTMLSNASATTKSLPRK